MNTLLEISDELNTVADNVEMCLDVIRDYYFDIFDSELKALGRYVTLTDFLHGTENIVRITSERIRAENDKIKELSEKALTAFRAEREQQNAPEPAEEG